MPLFFEHLYTIQNVQNHYVDDLNIIGTHKEILETKMYLKNKF